MKRSNPSPEIKSDRILVYRIGSLGDTIVALPSMWALKKNYPDAAYYLLSEKKIGSERVASRSLFEGSNIFEGYFSYPVYSGFWWRFAQPFRWLRLLWTLRQGHFDIVAYLAPSSRRPAQVVRDRIFFKLAGIRRMLGTQGFAAAGQRTKPLVMEAREADQILGRLALDGLSLPDPGEGVLDLCLGPELENKVQTWLHTLPLDNGKKWIGLGPGSNQPATVWPEKRYAEVVARLIEKWDIWPVVFGGKEDFPLGERLITAWARGYNACGILNVREAAKALQRCSLYLGNDSGTLHLAASVGVPCVGIYSAHNSPGKWTPYGEGHLVLRKQIDCEGCGLVECVERHMECILAISPDEVLDGCNKMLKSLIVT
jgi:heptosyltransferase-3